jgi:hypothetical protein
LAAVSPCRAEYGRATDRRNFMFMTNATLGHTIATSDAL